MGGARAAIAGVLAAAVVAWAVMPAPGDGWDTLRGLASLLGCIALLAGVDLASWWRGRRP